MSFFAKGWIKIRVYEDTSLLGVGTEALHGLFITAISYKFPETGDALHFTEKPKPFCVLPFVNARPLGGKVKLKRGKVYEFKVNLIGKDLIKKSIDSFKLAKDKEIIFNVGRSPCVVKDFYIPDPEGDECVKEKDIMERSRLKRDCIVDWITPYSYRFPLEGNINVPFPAPYQVFRSISEVWNVWCKSKISADFASSVLIKEYRLRTEMWKFHNYNIVGCVGMVKYGFDKLEEEELKKIWTLLYFGEFCGAGSKRAMGMGQMKIEEGEI